MADIAAYTNLWDAARRYQKQPAEFTDDAGKRQKYYMGCYGIGIGRTLAAIVEALGDSPDLDALRARTEALCAKRPLYPGFRGWTTYVA